MQRVAWGFLRKQVLQCCQKLLEIYKFSDSNAERRSLSIYRLWCRPRPSLNVKLCRWIVARKILISRRASSRKTPEKASAAEHGLGKRLTVLLIQDRSNNFVCLVPRRLSRCERGGRAREEGKGKGCETSGRFCFQDGGMFNGGWLRNFQNEA